MWRNGAVTVENRIWWFLKKLITIWPSNSALRYIPKIIENRCSNTCVYRHVPSNTIHNSQKVGTTYTSVKGIIDKDIVVYIYNGILLSHKKEWSMIRATVCMNLENTVVDERSQTQKIAYCMMSFIWSTQNRQIRSDRKKTGSFQWLRVEGNGENLLNGRVFPFGVVKITRNWREVVVEQHFECTECH